MARNDVVSSPPPSSFMAVQQNTLPQQELTTTTTTNAAANSSSSFSESDNLSPSIIVTVLVIATAVIVSATIYLLLRCISLHRNNSRRRRSSSSDAFLHRHNSERRISPEENSNSNSVIDSLPLFTYASIVASKKSASGGESGADCAVCLSKFEPQDKLRLLPVCCHAFHAECIDAWLATNQTCPLCRSSILFSESDLMNKLASTEENANANAPISAARSGSFRIEIGSVSNRRGRPSADLRSYSIGSFDYVLDDVVSEVTVASMTTRNKSGRGGGLETYVPAGPGEALAAEVAGGGRGSWLKEYVDRMTWTAPFSVSSSLRSSGRFFTGSSRRTEAARVNESDLEASRLGEEIGEMFRWLSGV